jgi:hypothetical protein
MAPRTTSTTTAITHFFLHQGRCAPDASADGGGGGIIGSAMGDPPAMADAARGAAVRRQRLSPHRPTSSEFRVRRVRDHRTMIDWIIGSGVPSG